MHRIRLFTGNDGQLSFQPTLRKHLIRGIGAYDQGCLNGSFIVANRTVAIRPIDLFQFSIAVYRNQLVEIPGGTAFVHHRFDLWPNDGPNLRPALHTALADGGGMFVGANTWTIAVVVKLDEFRS